MTFDKIILKGTRKTCMETPICFTKCYFGISSQFSVSINKFPVVCVLLCSNSKLLDFGFSGFVNLLDLWYSLHSLSLF